MTVIAMDDANVLYAGAIYCLAQIPFNSYCCVFLKWFEYTPKGDSEESDT
jgi:hypothetical protein